MAVVKLFAQLREIVGRGEVRVEASTVDQAVSEIAAQAGESFKALMPHCRIWLDGEPASGSDQVTAESEIAILPPVSGG
ncbi:MAG: MoaD/ThiS family protein [Actinomycetota bacterium]|nr:MoaD/ThiS family protein [Actinomycetota bacterium]